MPEKWPPFPLRRQKSWPHLELIFKSWHPISVMMWRSPSFQISQKSAKQKRPVRFKRKAYGSIQSVFSDITHDQLYVSLFLIDCDLAPVSDCLEGETASHVVQKAICGGMRHGSDETNQKTFRRPCAHYLKQSSKSISVSSSDGFASTRSWVKTFRWSCKPAGRFQMEAATGRAGTRLPPRNKPSGRNWRQGTEPGLAHRSSRLMGWLMRCHTAGLTPLGSLLFPQRQNALTEANSRCRWDISDTQPRLSKGGSYGALKRNRRTHNKTWQL